MSIRTPTLLGALLVVVALAPASAVEPGEVAGLVLGADKQTLSWNVEPLADHYNVYRGYLMELTGSYHGVPLEGEHPTTSFVETADPMPGHGFFYVVTAGNVDGEGTMGGNGTGERANTYAWPGRAVAGRWEEPRPWPTVAIHANLLHTGGLLTWQGGGVPTTTYTWDPVSDTFSTAILGTNAFCAGHSFMPDGKVFVTGGTIPLFNGRQETYLYDPPTNTWDPGPTMVKGRYYPSHVTAGDGTVLLFSGNDENGSINPRIERYDPKGQGSIDWIADKSMIIYPALHLLPDGRVFHTGPEAVTEIFDPVSGLWDFVDNTNFGRRGGGAGDFGSAMLPPGQDRFLIFGGIAPGADLGTASAEVIDLTDAVPAWRNVAPMHFPRQHPNHLILPDGRLLVAGGGYDGATPSHAAEIFDPATETWSVVGSTKGLFRLYHSTAILMPDGRAIWLGGTNPQEYPTAEFYSPGYLFRGPRPVITSSPAWVRYGRSFDIVTPDAANVTSVVMIRPSSTTHSRDFEQRYVALAFGVVGGDIRADAPSNENLAPPGYYMLWLVDADGVPSEARFIQLRG